MIKKSGLATTLSNRLLPIHKIVACANEVFLLWGNYPLYYYFDFNHY